MTTEIAVLNRLGVALAADSAVTISGAGTTKIFNSADKLFELSCVFPVAIMVNGSMDCFGVPWEIIVKDFREERGTKNKSIPKWTEDFLDFVGNRDDIKIDSAKKYVVLVTKAEGRLLANDIVRRVYQLRERQTSDGSFDAVAREAVADRRAKLASILIAETVKDVTTEALAQEYGASIREELAQGNFLPPVAGLEDDAVQLVLEALRAVIQNPHSTGLIIAGYGEGDTYPSVTAVEVHGYLLGRLKHSEIRDRAKIVKPELGFAVSFAQTDVIERLLSGADPRFIDKTSEFLSSAANRLAPLIVESYAPKARGSRKENEIRKIKQLLETIEKSYMDDTVDAFKTEFREEFERMIALMPKMELIELAEALINITAIERKATSDEGTVGGPIDVAFITKHEGFVWIKRKHYFQPSLNPRYFWRKFRHAHAEGAAS